MAMFRFRPRGFNSRAIVPGATAICVALGSTDSDHPRLLAPKNLASKNVVLCEAAPFRSATCTGNEAHTHNTRKISFKLNDGSSWTDRNVPVANVVVRATCYGAAETGCCACCKCPPPCGCPKGPNGCCACCKCPGTCGCPKKSEGKDAGPSVVARPYNPLSAESGNEFTLLVKKYENSKMGTKLHGLKSGDSVDIRGPNQQWSGWEKGKYQEYCLVAGGTGITPLMQTCQHILNNDSAVVTFVTFNKTKSDVLLEKELAELQAKFGASRLRVHHYVEESVPWSFFSSNVQTCKAYSEDGGNAMKSVLIEKLGAPSPAKFVMVCGRPDMTKFLAGPKTKDFKQGELGGVFADLKFQSTNVWKV